MGFLKISLSATLFLVYKKMHWVSMYWFCILQMVSCFDMHCFNHEWIWIFSFLSFFGHFYFSFYEYVFTVPFSLLAFLINCYEILYRLKNFSSLWCMWICSVHFWLIFFFAIEKLYIFKYQYLSVFSPMASKCFHPG